MTMCPDFSQVVRRHRVVARAVTQCFSRLVLLGPLTVCLLGTGLQVSAQSHGSGKPMSRDNSKAVAKMMDRYRAKLEVKDDAEWNIIRERISNVLSSERELRTVLLPQKKSTHGSGKSPEKESTSRSPKNRSTDLESESDADALRRLVETKAPAQQMHARLAKVRDSLREKQERLAAAREGLREVLSARQEAIALLNGLLH